MPRPQIEARRDAAVQSIVAHAARTVPFYRDMFAREGIDPRDIRGAAELDDLPLLDPELVRSDPGLFLSDSRRARARSPSGRDPWDAGRSRCSTIAVRSSQTSPTGSGSAPR